jgi:hypothetical protein
MKTILLFFLATCSLQAAFEYSMMDPILHGTSGSMVAQEGSYAGYLLNPALSAASTDLTAGLVYFRPFGMPDLSSAAIITRFSLRSLGSGLSLSTLGNELYRENQLTANISGKVLAEGLLLGVNLHWFSLQVENFENLNTFSIDAGLQYRPHDLLLIGFSIRNLNQPALDGRKQEIPLITSWGLAFRMHERFISYISLHKDFRYAPSLRLGFTMNPAHYLQLHSGVNTYPSVPSLGMSFIKKWIAIHYAFQYHFDLGGTHFWGISFSKPR